MVKKPPANAEEIGLGREDALEKGIAAHPRILAWRIPRTEKSGGLQSLGVAKSQTRMKGLSMHALQGRGGGGGGSLTQQSIHINY